MVDASVAGRRNLTTEQKSYLRGIRFLAEKQSQGGARKAKCQNDTLATEDTATRVAGDDKVARRTVYRDAGYAQGVTV